MSGATAGLSSSARLKFASASYFAVVVLLTAIGGESAARACDLSASSCQEQAGAADDTFDAAEPVAGEGADEPGAGEAAEAAAEPADGAPVGADGAAAGDGAGEAPPAELEDPAEQQALALAERDQTVQALLETKPSTPSELLRVTQTLIDLGHPIAARPLVKQLIAAQLDGEAAASLLNSVGSACLLKLSRAAWLQPDGETSAESIWNAASKYHQDPKRINDLVARLGRGTPHEQAWTIENLRRAGDAAAGPLLAALVRATDEAALAQVSSAITAVGRPLVPALRGAVDASPEPAAQVPATAATLLGELEADEAKPDLVALWLRSADSSAAQVAAEQALAQLGYRIGTRDDAIGYLEEVARQFYHDRPQATVSSDDGDEAVVTLWQWQGALKRFASRRVPVATANLIAAQRSARAAYWATIDGQHDDDGGSASETTVAARRRLLLAAIDLALAPPPAAGPAPLRPAGSPRELEEAAWLQDPALVNAVLREALAAGELATAEAAARTLGTIGSVELLDGTAALSPLAAAAGHGDPRVSAAAIESILRLGPTAPFVGASYVSRGLKYHLSALGLRRAVVASPNREEASRLVGLLALLGYEAEATTSGRIAAALAAESVDFELVVLDFRLYDPAAWEALAEIRRNARARVLPVAIIELFEFEEPARRLAAHDPRAAAWIRPHDAHGVAAQLAPLVARVDRDRGGDPRQRLTAAAAILEQLLALRPESRRLFDLALLVEPLERALTVPELQPRGATLLATLASPPAQQALVDLAGLSTAPMPLRKTAAQAFAESVERFGVLLTSVEVLHQYDRYNDSEQRPRAEQQILSHLLDVLEAGRDPRRAAE
ncbi:MAG: hypothetical protein K2Y37_13265 [Pirellulales bacterium]|nr:hypothetical protein [Pirellulales bacterium]